MNFRLKKFLSYYKPYLGLFSTVMLGAFIAAAITNVFPLLVRYITKTVLEGNLSDAQGEIFRIGALMLVLAALQAVCSFYYDYRGHTMGAMMENDLRSELFEHFQKLSFKFYDEQKTGQLMSRITNDLLSLSELYHHGPEDCIIYIVKLIGAFVILTSINFKLTLAVTFFLLVLGIFSLFLNKKINATIKRNRERISNINAQVEDSLSGIRVVKSFVNEEIEKKKFNYDNNRFLESRKNTYKNEAVFYGGVEVIINLITVTVIVFGGAAIVHTSLDLADLLTFLLYIGNLIEPVQKLTRMTTLFQEGVASFQRFSEILGIEPDIKDSSDAIVLKNIKGNIEFKNVAFRYRDDHDYVLMNLSFDIKAGDYIAIVGASGVGKTTLCSLIPRFYEASAGEILLDGVNIKDIRLNCLRKNIGVVQQDVYLFAGTVLENIRYGKPDANEEEIVRAAKRANAHEFIMKLPEGYNTDIGQRGVKLSGGQKQRLSIARVFLKDPPVLIFDEATSALDNENERVIKDSLECLARNRTTFVIAHRMSTIRNAKRILVLTEQGIGEQGTHEELIGLNGTYAQLYNSQSQMH